MLLDGLDQPHGLAFAGSTLYVAESDQIDAYDYADGAATNPRTVAADLPDARSPELRGAYAHALKSVAVGPDGAVYFSIGSTGNISAEDRDGQPAARDDHADPAGRRARRAVRDGRPQRHRPRRRTGRLGVDGGQQPRQRARSRTATSTPEYVNDHPPEALARLTPGRELGWPYCNPDGGPADLPFIRDMSTNADGSRMDCGSAAAGRAEPRRALGAAGTELLDGVLPAPYADGALVGVHGSWNRQPPRAPEVSFFPWRDGTLGDQQTLVGGFQADDGSRWGRPVAAVVGPDGAVYITDDYAGAIYRLAPPGR